MSIDFSEDSFEIQEPLVTTSLTRDDENEGSLRFHERVGYRYCTEFSGCGIKFGKSLGVIWMEKRSDSVELPICAPAPWHTIVKNDENLMDILASLPLS